MRMIPTISIKQVTYFSDQDLENIIKVLSNSNDTEIKFVIYFEEDGKEVYLKLHGSTRNNMYFKPCDTNIATISCLIDSKNIDIFDDISEICTIDKDNIMEDRIARLRIAITNAMSMKGINDIKSSIKGDFDIVFDGSKFMNDLSEGKVEILNVKE